MKLLFDILAATERSGGMRLHAIELIHAWLETYPDDEVLILGGKWAKEAFSGPRVRIFPWQNENIAGRAFGQIITSAVLGLAYKVDFVVSLSPIVSPLVPRKRSACFQHDWRHKKNPHEFPKVQRLYRKLWELSAAHAGVNLCISEKAETETVTYVPSARTMIAQNGRDHAKRWTHSAPKPGSKSIVTFGHHNNKRPELVIDALALLAPSELKNVNLTVLGARGKYAEELGERCIRLGLDDIVNFPGFVSDEEYQKIISSAGVVVMASSDEGFGLPAAEAEYFNIPALVTSDSGMVEIFKDSVISASPTPESLAEGLSVALAAPVAEKVTKALFGWNDTAFKLRAALVSLNSFTGSEERIMR